MSEKRRRLEVLAADRKHDRRNGYKTFADFHNEKFDKHGLVVPWTISAHNYDAEVMIIGQDWASEAFLENDRCRFVTISGQTPCLPTNYNLKILLMMHLNLRFEDTYATDLFVFVKPGGMNEGIAERDLKYCAMKYALPQIDIIRPRVVMCLGSSAYNALRRTLGIEYRKLRDQWDKHGRWDELKYKDVDIIGVTHTGAQGINLAGGLEGPEITRQWQFVASRLGIDAESRKEQRDARSLLGAELRCLCMGAAPWLGATNAAPATFTNETKQEIITRIMKANADKPKDEVVALIVAEAGLQAGRVVDLRRARAYYSEFVRKGLAPGGP